MMFDPNQFSPRDGDQSRHIEGQVFDGFKVIQGLPREINSRDSAKVRAILEAESLRISAEGISLRKLRILSFIMNSFFTVNIRSDLIIHNEVPDKLRATPYRLRSTFLLADRLEKMNLGPHGVNSIRATSEKIRGYSKIRKELFLHALEVFGDTLGNIANWRSLENAFSLCNFSRLNDAINTSKTWAFNCQRPHLAATVLRSFMTTWRQGAGLFEDLIATRKARTATVLGDECRLIVLKDPVSWADTSSRDGQLMLLKKIGALEEESKTLVPLHAVLTALLPPEIPTNAFLQSYGYPAEEWKNYTETLLLVCKKLIDAGVSPHSLADELFLPVYFVVGEALAAAGAPTYSQQKAMLLQFETSLAAFKENITQQNASQLIDKCFQELRQQLEIMPGLVFHPLHGKKLSIMLEAKNIPSSSSIFRGLAPFRLALTELRCHALIEEAVRTVDKGKRHEIESLLADSDYAASDNPPFSLTQESNAVQAKFMRQIRDTNRRMIDGHYAFMSQAFSMSRLPISKRCFFQEMAKDIGAQQSVVRVKDNNRFPGGGRLITGIDPSTIFAPDSGDGNRDPLHRWKHEILVSLGPIIDSKRSHNVHALVDINETKFLFLRGLRAISGTSEFFKLRGEALTYVEFNHHFDSTGVNLAYLVPSRAFWLVIKKHLKDVDSPALSKTADDITEDPLTISAIRRQCRKLSTAVGVINLGTASNYQGGFCNGFEIGSMPYHAWEERTKSEQWQYKDNFGHFHKWHINGHDQELKRLWQAHQQVFEITNAYLNRLDLFKVIESRYSWGQTATAIDEQNQKAFELSDDVDIGTSEDMDVAAPEESYRDESWRTNSLRMLQWITDALHEHQLANSSRDQIPVLALQTTIQQSRIPISPFIIDAADGIVWRRGKKPLLFPRTDGVIPQNIQDWWLEDVAPLSASAKWPVPKLLHRDLYLTQIEEIKKEIRG